MNVKMNVKGISEDKEMTFMATGEKHTKKGDEGLNWSCES